MKDSEHELIERDVGSLRPYPGNARTHSKKQVGQIARSIKRFGFTNPVLISDAGEIIAGLRQTRNACWRRAVVRDGGG